MCCKKPKDGMANETASMILRCLLFLPLTAGVGVAILGPQQRDLNGTVALAAPLLPPLLSNIQGRVD